jgi:3-oxoacyl-[acyl-carrier protein] reductase
MVASKFRSPLSAMTTSSISLAGRTALVTGASAGIGWATAVALARQGANVVVTARREERLLQLCAEIESLGVIGAKAVPFAGDAAVEATAQQAIALAISTFGRLDILINNAGAGNYKNLVDTSADEYDALMNANMRSGFLFSRHAAPHLIAQKSGTILFISSIAGLQGAAGEAVYSASKFAQVGFAQSLDAELRKHGIKVGTVCPGGVKTEFALGHGRTEDFIRNSHMMEPQEVAEAIVFACLQPPNLRIPQMTVRHMG